MQIHEFAERYDSLASEDPLYEIPLRKEFVLANIGRGNRVLDVGCLGGRLTDLIRRQNNRVWGVEINAAAAEEARKRGIQVKVADVERGLPYDNAMFDVVNAGEVVEHLYDTKFFFSECARVLAPGGILLFTTPNLNSLENRLRVVSGQYLALTGAFPEDHFGTHIRVLNAAKIQELCRQTGFEVEELRGIPTLASKGPVVDLGLATVGRLFPSLSKLLMARARKLSAA